MVWTALVELAGAVEVAGAVAEGDETTGFVAEGLGEEAEVVVGVGLFGEEGEEGDVGVLGEIAQGADEVFSGGFGGEIEGFPGFEASDLAVRGVFGGLDIGLVERVDAEACAHGGGGDHPEIEDEAEVVGV